MRPSPLRVALGMCAAPALAFFAAFWLLPMARLISVGAGGPEGGWAYLDILTHPAYRRSFVATTLLAIGVTLSTLVLASVTGVFLERHRFAGRRLVVTLITFPLAFPGVVVGFLVIILVGRQGIITLVIDAVFGSSSALAYGLVGLYLGYLYFSLPRVIVTMMAAASKLDSALEEAARSLGASRWQVVRDVILPALAPALVASGAICFATAMGAFGTAFTLATRVTVLPITIYNEFTNYANFASAASLSIVLGVITWLALFIARSLAGAAVVAGA
ncbi:MAG: ABC transporter permease [Burkholderiaceae bacterium]|jgi:putative spermidine/putrescine transport system permease protein